MKEKTHGFGASYKDLPTPEAIVLRVTIISMIFGGLITIIPLIDQIPQGMREIFTSALGTAITIANYLKDFWGKKVGMFVKGTEVGSVKETAKIIIFIVLANSYFWAELLISNF